LQAFMQSKQIRHTHLTISDERNLAAAFVVLET
jgi:phosphopantetheinyl transferase (holo-ACP synthase)